LLCLLGPLCAGAVQAQGVAAKYPAGSLKSREDAAAALGGIKSERSRNEQEQREAEQRCAKTFFVNSCRDEARRKYEATERELRRVELEARGVQRRLDEEERLARRAEEDARRAAE